MTVSKVKEVSSAMQSLVASSGLCITTLLGQQHPLRPAVQQCSFFNKHVGVSQLKGQVRMGEVSS